MLQLLRRLAASIRDTWETAVDYVYTWPVRRAQTELWYAARTFPELADLHRRWWNGELLVHPAFYGRIRPGRHQRLLAAAAQAGFIVMGWSDGVDQDGWRAKEWAGEQARAWVGGYTTKQARDELRLVAAQARLVFHNYNDVLPAMSGPEGEVVPAGDVSHHRPPGDVDLWRHYYCSEEALEVLDDASQVTLIDPAWERRTEGPQDYLWIVLESWLRERGLITDDPEEGD